MSARLYFDLKAVADQARHAILADHNHRTQQEIDDNTPARPALWFYRLGGRVKLSSNGLRDRLDILSRNALSVDAQPHDALTTPVIRPPKPSHSIVLPLLHPGHHPLYDQLINGLAAGCQ